MVEVWERDGKSQGLGMVVTEALPGPRWRQQKRQRSVSWSNLWTIAATKASTSGVKHTVNRLLESLGLGARPTWCLPPETGETRTYDEQDDSRKVIALFLAVGKTFSMNFALFYMRRCCGAKAALYNTFEVLYTLTWAHPGMYPRKKTSWRNSYERGTRNREIVKSGQSRRLISKQVVMRGIFIRPALSRKVRPS